MSGLNWGVGGVLGGMSPLYGAGDGFSGVSLPRALTAAAYALSVPGFGLPALGVGLGMGLFGAGRSSYGRDPGFMGVAALTNLTGSLQRGGMGMMGMALPWIGGGFYLGPGPGVMLMHMMYQKLFSDWFGLSEPQRASAPAASNVAAQTPPAAPAPAATPPASQAQQQGAQPQAQQQAPAAASAPRAARRGGGGGGRRPRVPSKREYEEIQSLAAQARSETLDDKGARRLRKYMEKYPKLFEKPTEAAGAAESGSPGTEPSRAAEVYRKIRRRAELEEMESKMSLAPDVRAELDALRKDPDLKSK